MQKFRQITRSRCCTASTKIVLRTKFGSRILMFWRSVENVDQCVNKGAQCLGHFCYVFNVSAIEEAHLIALVAHFIEE